MKYMLLLGVVTSTVIGHGGIITLKKHWIVSAIMSSLALVTVGCSTSQPSENQTPLGSNNATQPLVKVSKKPLDGTLASIQEIKTYRSFTGTDVRLYKLLYWSNGFKVEAFLTEPTKPGKYPLIVNLHGGYMLREIKHDSFGYTAKQAAYLSNSHTVMLYPEYQGYMGSQGPVMGIKTDMTDVTNAIAVAKSLGEVKTNNTYVIGYSLGGGLALMTAVEDHQVRAVIAVSPFVGFTDFVKWAQSNSKPGSVFFGEMASIQEDYGENINSLSYKQRSPDVQSIQAPVLLLQGTADHHVAWQSVQLFAQQMKSTHKTVKLVLYQGGHHGLYTGAYQSESTQQINNWFAKYGLNVQL